LKAIGVLALQGDWAAHSTAVRELGAEVLAVRSAADLADVRALVIPGGESSAMLRLMEPEELSRRIVERIRAGMAVLATCAGVILLAQAVVPKQPCLGVLAIDVERNAYGRQVFSTIAEIELAPDLGGPPGMEGVFIRAPRIIRREAAIGEEADG
jgi:5'-phosphate synthase pdxT subunit